MEIILESLALIGKLPLALEVSVKADLVD